jgi:hypothetical protein
MRGAGVAGRAHRATPQGPKLPAKHSHWCHDTRPRRSKQYEFGTATAGSWFLSLGSWSLAPRYTAVSGGTAPGRALGKKARANAKLGSPGTASGAAARKLPSRPPPPPTLFPSDGVRERACGSAAAQLTSSPTLSWPGSASAAGRDEGVRDKGGARRAATESCAALGAQPKARKHGSHAREGHTVLASTHRHARLTILQPHPTTGSRSTRLTRSGQARHV